MIIIIMYFFVNLACEIVFSVISLFSLFCKWITSGVGVRCGSERWGRVVAGGVGKANKATEDEVKCSRCFSSLIKVSNMRLLKALGMWRKKVTDGGENESV